MHKRWQGNTISLWLYGISGILYLLMPSMAWAADPCQNPGLLNRVVPCIGNTVIVATENFLLPFSAIMADTVAACCLFAVILFGFRVAIGQQRKITSDTFILAIKLGLVIMFSWNFGGWFPYLIDTINYLVITVSGYLLFELDGYTLKCPTAITVWLRIDCALDQLIGGILPGSLFSFGMGGFVISALFTPFAGFTIFMIGIGFFLTLLMAVAKAMYVFLSAYIAIALLVIVSPIFVPLVLFRVTKAYYEKWLRLLIGLIIQPIFLFVYIAMLMAGFDVVIFSGERSVYRAIAGDAIDQPNFYIGKHMLGEGYYIEEGKFDKNINLNPKQMAGMLGMKVQNAGMFGNLRELAGDLNKKAQIQTGSNFPVDVPIKVLDIKRMSKVLGGVCVAPANEQQQNDCITTYIVRVILSMFTALVVAYIFYTLLAIIPYLGVSMAGEILSLPNLAKGFDVGSTMGKLQDQVSRDPGRPIHGAPVR